MLFASLIDGIKAFIAGPQYRQFCIQNEHFKHEDKMLKQIKGHNAKYSKATQANHWQKYFSRDPKKDAKPFVVYNSKGQGFWLFDISQTTGKALQEIYQNIAGDILHYHLVWDCLTGLLSWPVVFSEEGYYSGIGQDAASKNGAIIMRPGLSEQQRVFALVREIVRTNQTSAIIIEAASHMVCRHLGFDTSAFTYGYLLELMDYDVSLGLLNNKDITRAAVKEAAELIGKLNAGLPFLQTMPDDSASDGSPSGAGPSDAAAALGRLPSGSNAFKIDEPKQAKPDDANANDTAFRTRQHSKTVENVDFITIEILRSFMRTLPDKSISISQMNDYGYHDENMLPLREAVAKKLFADRREIYRLYKDGTDTTVDTMEEIEAHNGLYGISANDWAVMKVNIFRASVDKEIKNIGLWERYGEGGEVLKGKKHPGQPNEQPKEQPDEQFEYDDQGRIIFAQPDISHRDFDGYEWIDNVMEDLIDNHGYATLSIPYFKDLDGLGLATEMDKINSFMIECCYFCITQAVLQHTKRCKKTGNSKVFVMKAARQIFTEFNTRHVALALKVHWSRWPTHDKIKVQFFNGFKELATRRDAIGANSANSADRANRQSE
jgi:hypothetical protein